MTRFENIITALVEETLSLVKLTTLSPSFSLYLSTFQYNFSPNQTLVQTKEGDKYPMTGDYSNAIPNGWSRYVVNWSWVGGFLSFLKQTHDQFVAMWVNVFSKWVKFYP